MKNRVCVITAAGKRVCGRRTTSASGAAKRAATTVKVPKAPARKIPQAEGRAAIDGFARALRAVGYDVYMMESDEAGITGPSENIYVEKGGHILQMWWHRGKYSVIVSTDDGEVLRSKSFKSFPEATSAFADQGAKLGS